MTNINIYVFSYNRFNTLMKTQLALNDDNVELASDIAIISISNTDGSMPHWFVNCHKNVLNVDFDDCTKDDVINDVYTISSAQAKEIVEFTINNQAATTFIVHCEAGISRSTAVAIAINDILKCCDSTISSTIHFGYACHPNPEVSRKIDAEIRKIDF